MLRKGEVVSLAIFVILGLLVSSLLVSGGPVGDDDKKKLDFGDGSVEASVVWGIYTEEGELVEAESLGAQMVGAESGDPVSYWQATVADIKVDGKNVDPNSLGVGIVWYASKPGAKTLKTVQPANWELDFTVQGTPEQFTAESEWFDSYKINLIDLANQLKIDYKQRVDWELSVDIGAWGNAVSDGSLVKSKIWVYKMTFSTDWVPETVPGGGNLIVTGFVTGGPASWADLDSVGLSITFVILVIFVGLWYKWGRNLIVWG